MRTQGTQLESKILEKLRALFQGINSIDEVYQYTQTMNNELSIVLGIKLLEQTEKAKAATLNAVQTALKDETLNKVVDLTFITGKEDLLAIQNLEEALIYKKSL